MSEVRNKSKVKKSFVASVGIRGPTYSVAGGFETISKEALKNIEMNSETTLEDARDKLIRAYAKIPEMSIDEKGGKVYTASTSASVKMLEVKDNIGHALNKGKSGGSIAHFSIGPFVLSQGSNGAITNLRNPPPIPITKSVKAAASSNTANSLTIRNFVEDLYHKPESPFFHGFTTYHSQLIPKSANSAKKRHT